MSCGASRTRATSAATSPSGPDDAFFTPGYRPLTTNDEFNDAVAQIDLRRRRIVWTYGRACVAGSGPGELPNPDDAYLVRGGTIQVADIPNCRILRLDEARKVIAWLGPPGSTRRAASTSGRRVDASSGLRTEVGSRSARSSLARGSLAERADRRQGRLAPLRGRRRSAHRAHRLALRSHRQRLLPTRVSVKAGRARSAPGSSHRVA